MHSDAPAGLAAALAFAAEGVHVLRIAPNMKRPAEEHGHHDATADLATLRLRFSAMPDAGVGMALAPSRVAVVDIDDPRPHGTFNAAVGKLGALPPTRTHRTPSGGAHLIYRVPEDAGPLKRRIRPWGPSIPVDLLGDGYAILPPSTVDGRAYVVQDAGPIVDAPQALLDAMRAPAARAVESIAADGEIIAAGTANGVLWQRACDLRRAGLAGQEHEDALVSIAVAQCEVSPDLDAVRGIATRARAQVEADGIPKTITTAGKKKPEPRDDAPAPTGVRVVSTVSAASVKIETTQFVDPHHTVPVGALTVLAGDPGLGKTTWAMRLDARVSKGSAGYRSGSVIVVSAEDSPSTTLVPRLRAEGANLDRVHFLKAETDGAPDGLRLPDDVDELRRVVEATGAVLVVVDPLNAHLGAEINGHRDQDIRRALAPLHRLCEDLAISIVLVAHLNKAVGGTAVYRVGGSIGVMGAARSGVLMTAHPESDDDGDEDTSALRVLSHVKCNVGPKAPGHVYRIEPVTIEADGHTVETSRLAYVGESDLDSATLLDPPKPKRSSAKEEATQWLRDFLAGGESISSADVKQAAEDAGFSSRTVQRASQDLVVIEEITTEQGRQTMWRLRPLGRQGVAPKRVAPSDEPQVGPTPQSPQTLDETPISQGVRPSVPLLADVGPTPPPNLFLALSSNGASSAT